MSSVAGPAESPRSNIWRVARRLSWIGVLIVGVLAYLLVLHTLLTTQNSNFIPSLILLGSIVVPTTVLVFAATGGPSVTVPAGLLSGVAIVGGLIGTVAAGTWEYDALHRLGALPMIFVGLIEETAKLIIPALVLIITRKRYARAGVIIGVASGMGFAALETMGYGFSALLGKNGSLADLEQTLLFRALLSPAGHVAWTGVTAAALWHILVSRHKGRAILLAIGTFIAAVLLHAAWDGFNNLIVHLIVGGVSFIGLMLVIHRAHKQSVQTLDPL